MKSESAIRRQIAALRNRNLRNRADVREKAAIEALIGGLEWVVNKDRCDPVSHAIDAMIDDIHALEEPRGIV